MAAEREVEVVAEAEDGRTAVELARAPVTPQRRGEDIGHGPASNGIEATRQISESVRSVRVIALSAYADRRHDARCYKAGASGIPVERISLRRARRGIRTAAASASILKPAPIAGEKLVVRLVRMSREPGPSVFEVALPGEREVLQIAEGHSTKEVARILKVSVKTVETHRRQLMNKLQLFSSPR